MTIYLHPVFVKHYRQRIAALQRLDGKYRERVKVFARDHGNTTLRDHPLSGTKRHLRAFSVTGDIRIVYRLLQKGDVEFMDIGTHNQVY